ncbi:Mor family transcriptional regulator [Rhodobium orientis]|uniref:Uncharacterized protein n=1 Tax=Rhodobium orientis TaxID=34017 RepID=A0A327JRX2_9HYPH|nr:helix-turn-helix domain-containing protein [Rhodobium orientis]MBB4302333.1 Mor family transcriptional regulator [Rhodobium orientis]MBK5949039.1 hypothetical protein [Rhodobium orientis]RAI29027.1 hypothetical protein CH339_04930 [Rhodobium orientis]
MTGSFDGLPALLAEFAEEIGLEGALKIAEARGGQQVYLPSSVSDDHWLSELVGRPAAEKLCRRYCARGGINLVIPLGPAGHRSKARRRLFKALAEGKSVSETVRASGVHERTVYRAKARLKDDTQGDLF